MARTGTGGASTPTGGNNMSGWAAAAGGIASLWGQSMANKANAREGKRNRAFQERMSNTAHQRETTDLEKAGLNRILGISQSGASTPGGAMPVHKSITEGAVSSAKEALMMNAALKKMEAETKQVEANTVNTDLDSGKKGAENALYGHVISGIDAFQGFGKWLGTSSAKAVNGLQNLQFSDTGTGSEPIMRIKINKALGKGTPETPAQLRKLKNKHRARRNKRKIPK